MLSGTKKLLINAWSDHFSSVASPGETSLKQTTQYSNTASSNLYIINSAFEYSQSSDEGGAIRVSQSSTSYCLLIEKTTLFHCRSSSKSGAIYFGNYGQCVLANICAYNCCSINNVYQFAYIETSNGIQYKGEVLDSSISNCRNSEYADVLCVCWGKIKINTVNFSSNEANQFSGIRSLPYYSSNEPISDLIHYSSFSNNTASDSCCIYLHYIMSYTLVEHEIKSCNIINCNQSSTSQIYGLIHSLCKASIEGSCFVNNEHYFLFMNSGSYQVTVSNCTIDSGFMTSGSVNVDN